MSAQRLLLFAAALAVIGALVWWAVDTRPLAPPVWEIEAENPLLIGTRENPFAYTGGNGVQPVDGSARLAQDPDEEAPTLHASIHVPEAIALPWWNAASSGDVDLVLRLNEDAPIDRWEDVAIHGDTGVGDPRLPQTHARFAGHGTVSLSDDSGSRVDDLPVFWSVAQAIRQPDGGIRQQGLTFSPLLRDKRGFSDPDRWELTLLVYDASADGGPGETPVLLQIVYRTLVIVPPDSSE